MSFSIFLYEIHFFGQSLPQPQLVHLQSVQVQGPPEPQPQSVSGMVRQYIVYLPPVLHLLSGIVIFPWCVTECESGTSSLN